MSITSMSKAAFEAALGTRGAKGSKSDIKAKCLCASEGECFTLYHGTDLQKLASANAAASVVRKNLVNDGTLDSIKSVTIARRKQDDGTIMLLMGPRSDENK